MITSGIPGRIKYINGSVSVPEAGGLRYILQFVGENGVYPEKEIAVNKRWPKVSQQYRQLYLEKHGKLTVGNTQTVAVQSDTIVVNMIVLSNNKLDLNSLNKCLENIININKTDTGSIHIAKYGTVKQWKDIEKSLGLLTKAGLNVVVYQ